MQFSFPYAAISLVVSITVAFVTFGKNIFDSILVACNSYYDCLFLFSLIDKNCGQRRECSAG